MFKVVFWAESVWQEGYLVDEEQYYSSLQAALHAVPEVISEPIRIDIFRFKAGANNRLYPYCICRRVIWYH